MADLKKAEQYKAVLYLLATAVLWSFGGVLIKWVDLTPMAIAGWRSAIAVPLLVLCFRSAVRITWSKYQIAGAICYAATVCLFVAATKLTSAANAILLQYTAPIYIALASAYFLNERIRWYDWSAIVVVLSGMVLFFFDTLGSGSFTGNLLAIASGVSFAGLIISLRKQKEASPLSSVLLGNLLTALVGLPFMFLKMPDMTGWAGLLLLGIFQLGLSYVFYAAAIKRVTAIEGILIPILEPVLNPVWVFLFLGEMPGQWALIGGLIIVGAVLARSLVAVRQEMA
jgi:drug/metabolite transporter (DMT)-like permease